MRELEGVELEQDVAERVMGWKPHTNFGDNEPSYPCYNYGVGGMVVWRSWNNYAKDWSPLRSMSDTYEVVTAMNAKGWMLETLQNGAMETIARFLCYEVESPWYAPDGVSKNPGEAICRASLSALRGARS